MGRTPHLHDMGGSPIIVTENVAEYRKAIAEYVTASDTVLEVGCAEGLTTAYIARVAAQAYGIDKSSGQVARAHARHTRAPNLHFKMLDAWDLNGVLAWASECNACFNVIFLDVSGSRRVGDVESLLRKYEQVFAPGLFVVKNFHLKRLVNRCRLFSPPGCGRPYKGQPREQERQAEEQQGELQGRDAAAAAAAGGFERGGGDAAGAGGGRGDAACDGGSGDAAVPSAVAAAASAMQALRLVPVAAAAQ